MWGLGEFWEGVWGSCVGAYYPTNTFNIIGALIITNTIAGVPYYNFNVEAVAFGFAFRSFGF